MSITQTILVILLGLAIGLGIAIWLSIITVETITKAITNLPSTIVSASQGTYNTIVSNPLGTLAVVGTGLSAFAGIYGLVGKIRAEHNTQQIQQRAADYQRRTDDILYERTAQLSEVQSKIKVYEEQIKQYKENDPSLQLNEATSLVAEKERTILSLRGQVDILSQKLDEARNKLQIVERIG